METWRLPRSWTRGETSPELKMSPRQSPSGHEYDSAGQFMVTLNALKEPPIVWWLSLRVRGEGICWTNAGINVRSRTRKTQKSLAQATEARAMPSIPSPQLAPCQQLLTEGHLLDSAGGSSPGVTTAIRSGWGPGHMWEHLSSN